MGTDNGSNDRGRRSSERHSLARKNDARSVASYSSAEHSGGRSHGSRQSRQNGGFDDHESVTSTQSPLIVLADKYKDTMTKHRKSRSSEIKSTGSSSRMRLSLIVLAAMIAWVLLYMGKTFPDLISGPLSNFLFKEDKASASGLSKKGRSEEEEVEETQSSSQEERTIDQSDLAQTKPRGDSGIAKLKRSENEQDPDADLAALASGTGANLWEEVDQVPDVDAGGAHDSEAATSESSTSSLSVTESVEVTSNQSSDEKEKMESPGLRSSQSDLGSRVKSIGTFRNKESSGGADFGSSETEKSRNGIHIDDVQNRKNENLLSDIELSSTNSEQQQTPSSARDSGSKVSNLRMGGGVSLQPTLIDRDSQLHDSVEFSSGSEQTMEKNRKVEANALDSSSPQQDDERIVGYDQNFDDPPTQSQNVQEELRASGNNPEYEASTKTRTKKFLSIDSSFQNDVLEEEQVQDPRQGDAPQLQEKQTKLRSPSALRNIPEFKDSTRIHDRKKLSSDSVQNSVSLRGDFFLEEEQKQDLFQSEVLTQLRKSVQPDEDNGAELEQFGQFRQPADEQQQLQPTDVLMSEVLGNNEKGDGLYRHQNGMRLDDTQAQLSDSVVSRRGYAVDGSILEEQENYGGQESASIPLSFKNNESAGKTVDGDMQEEAHEEGQQTEEIQGLIVQQGRSQLSHDDSSEDPSKILQSDVRVSGAAKPQVLLSESSAFGERFWQNGNNEVIFKVNAVEEMQLKDGSFVADSIDVQRNSGNTLITRSGGSEFSAVSDSEQRHQTGGIISNAVSDKGLQNAISEENVSPSNLRSQTYKGLQTSVHGLGVTSKGPKSSNYGGVATTAGRGSPIMEQERKEMSGKELSFQNMGSVDVLEEGSVSSSTNIEIRNAHGRSDSGARFEGSLSRQPGEGLVPVENSKKHIMDENTNNFSGARGILEMGELSAPQGAESMSGSPQSIDNGSMGGSLGNHMVSLGVSRTTSAGISLQEHERADSLTQQRGNLRQSQAIQFHSRRRLQDIDHLESPYENMNPTELSQYVSVHAYYRNLLDFEKDLPFDPSSQVPYLFHIHKSGGSSLKQSLACMGLAQTRRGSFEGCDDQEDTIRACPLQWGTFVNADPSSHQGIERIKKLKMLDHNIPNLVLTTSRFSEVLSIFTPEHKGRLFLLLRDPVERGVSKYYYSQIASWENNFNPAIANMTLVEYAQSAFYVDNWIVRRIVHKMNPLATVTPGDLRLAKEVLRQKALILLLSDFERSSYRLVQFFGWGLTDDHRQCARKYSSEVQINRNPHPIPTRDSPEWAAIRQKNLMDIELYRYAVELYYNYQGPFLLEKFGPFSASASRDSLQTDYST